MTTRNVCIALALISVGACGGSGGSTAPNNQTSGNTTPAAGDIAVTNNSFSPSTKTVAPGTAVNWAWNTCTGDGYSGQICVDHSVTFDDGTTSPTQDRGTYVRTFAAAGTYNYHCSVHGAAMSGTITVQ
ncbi:MAG TPA: plastocyanin/azurin family copper-binding protein [Gemmatimonadaceae bacterium]|jgi:plastocyanin|nr:plastocyanin/azurin family copper-binding protein [Gemmatimonadaceae bacterium]